MSDKDKNNDETWVKDWYDDKGRSYLMNNLQTQKGRDSVVKFNNFLPQWTECSAGKKSCCRQVHVIAKLLSEKKMKDGIYAGPVEGMHRMLVIVHVHTKSAPDYSTGILR